MFIYSPCIIHLSAAWVNTVNVLNVHQTYLSQIKPPAFEICRVLFNKLIPDCHFLQFNLIPDLSQQTTNTNHFHTASIALFRLNSTCLNRYHACYHIQYQESCTSSYYHWSTKRLFCRRTGSYAIACQTCDRQEHAARFSGWRKRFGVVTWLMVVLSCLLLMFCSFDLIRPYHTAIWYPLAVKSPGSIKYLCLVAFILRTHIVVFLPHLPPPFLHLHRCQAWALSLLPSFVILQIHYSISFLSRASDAVNLALCTYSYSQCW